MAEPPKEPQGKIVAVVGDGAGPRRATEDKGSKPKRQKPIGRGISPISGLNREQVRDLVKEMIETSTKLLTKDFENLQSRIATELSKLDRLNHYPTTRVLVGWGLGIMVTIMAFVVGLFAIAGDRWDNGLSTGSEIGSKLERTDNSLEELNRKIDRLFDEDAKKNAYQGS